MMLSLLAVFSLLNAVAVIMLGQYILLKNSRAPLNRVFALLCTYIGAWAFVEFMYRQAATAASAVVWVRVIVTIWPYAPALVLHFALLFCKKTRWLRNPLTYFVIYFPSVLITVAGLTTKLISPGPVKRPWGFETAIPQNSVYFAMSGTWIILLVVAAIVIILRYRSKITDPIIKKQALLISLGFSIPLIPGALTEIILPISGIVVPPLTVNYMIGLVALTAYAMSRYGLFVLSPEAAAPNILATMSEALLIVNPKGRILDFNKALLDMLGYTASELQGKSARFLWADREKVRLLLRSLPYEGPPLHNFEGRFLRKDGETIDVLFSVSAIKGRGGYLAGFVGTATDITELKGAREVQGIADYLQEALLKMPRKMEGIKFGHLYRSATEKARVGGDFFDLFKVKDDEIGIVVGDVSGKGIAAAAMTSLIKDTLKAYSFLYLPPASIMSKANEVVARTSAPDMFATVFFGILNIRSGELDYCNAGHLPAIIKTSNRIKTLEPNSTLIGFFMGQDYVSDKVLLDRGDLLVLYTDGITEARRQKEFFGEERLFKFIADAEKTTAKELPRKVLAEVTDFSQGKLADDIAILTIVLENKPETAQQAA